MLVTCFIDPLIAQSSISSKRHKKKALNWLKLITKEVQAQAKKDLWY